MKDKENHEMKGHLQPPSAFITSDAIELTTDAATASDVEASDFAFADEAVAAAALLLLLSRLLLGASLIFG